MRHHYQAHRHRLEEESRRGRGLVQLGNQERQLESRVPLLQGVLLQELRSRARDEDLLVETGERLSYIDIF